MYGVITCLQLFTVDFRQIFRIARGASFQQVNGRFIMRPIWLMMGLERCYSRSVIPQSAISDMQYFTAHLLDQKLDRQHLIAAVQTSGLSADTIPARNNDPSILAEEIQSNRQIISTTTINNPKQRYYSKLGSIATLLFWMNR